MSGGHRAVIFFYPPLDLFKEGRAKILKRFEGRVRIGVFRFQVGPDVRLQDARVLHQRLPVRVPEPVIKVGTRNAVPCVCNRALVGDGSGRRKREGHVGLSDMKKPPAGTPPKAS